MEICYPRNDILDVFLEVKMELITQYLRRPFQEKEWVKKIGMGGIIGFIPILNFSLMGYLLEWMLSIYKEPEISEHIPLPEWKEWGKLLANGLMVLVIVMIYCLLPLILLWIGRSMATLGTASMVLGHLFKFLAGIGLAIVSFILPVALIQFAHSGKIEAAFHIKAIGEKIAGVFPEYLISYLFSLGLVILSWIVIAILSSIILGYIFVPVLNFYIGLVIAYRFSRLLGR